MDLDWDDEEVTRPTGSPLLPAVPINPRIRILGSTKVLGSAPGFGDDRDEPPPTTRDFLDGTPEERAFDERETTEREKVTPSEQGAASGDAPASVEAPSVPAAAVGEADSGIVVAPIVSVEGPPSSLPTWDDMTEPVLTVEEAPETTVDDAPPPAKRSMRILQFDVAPPKVDPLPMTMPRASAFALQPPDSVPAPPTSASPGSAAPGSAAPGSVEVDLSHLDPFADTSSPSQLSAPAATPQVLSGLEEDEEQVFPKPQTDWLPLEEHAVVTAAPRARRPQELRSVPPVTMSSPPPDKRRRRGIAIAAFGVMLILCSTIFVLWMFPKKGSVLVRLRTEDGHPAAKAEIYVDGQKHCDTDPCRIEGLARGDRTIKVIVPGSDEPRVANVQVHPGVEETVWIDVPSTVQAEERSIEEKADAVAPSVTIHLATRGARVVLIPEGGVGRVVEGPFPRKLELALGRYEIVASLPGYAPFVDHVTLSEKAPTADVDVRLIEREGSSGTAAEDAEAKGEAKGEAKEDAAARVEKHSPYWDPYANVEWD